MMYLYDSADQEITGHNSMYI